MTGGRIVVPLRLHGSGLTRSLALDMVKLGRLVSASAKVCGFVPMRGAAAAAEHHLRLADDVVLHVDADSHADADRLGDALGRRGHQQWTGVNVRHAEPAEHLDLWLATSTSLPFARIAIGPTAHVLELPAPAVRWAGAAVHSATTIAYLTARPAAADTDQIGVAAYGPDAAELANHLTQELERWGENRPMHPVITVSPGREPHAAAIAVRPSTSIGVTWAAAAPCGVQSSAAATNQRKPRPF